MGGEGKQSTRKGQGLAESVRIFVIKEMRKKGNLRSRPIQTGFGRQTVIQDIHHDFIIIRKENQMKRKLFERPFVLFMVLIMILGILPLSALAADGSDNPTAGLTDLAFGGDAFGAPGYAATPSFDNGKTTYTVSVPDYAGNLYCYAKVANSGDKVAAFRAVGPNNMMTALSSGSWTWLYGLTTGPAGLNYTVKVGSNPSVDSTVTASYSVAIQRYVTLSGLTVNDTLCPTFNADTLNYTAGVAADATSVSIKATAYQSAYGLTVNGVTATSGTAATVNLNWDSNGQMQVPIVVSSSGATSTTYTLTLIKETKGDTPLFSMQPLDATYFDTVTAATPLKVRASANGTLSYQWYKNTTKSTENATKIEGATTDTYIPAVVNVGTTAKTAYYYCTVTNTKEDSSTFNTTSAIATINVKPDPTPTVTIVAADGSDIPVDGYTYSVGATNAIALKVEATTRADGGKWTYEWSDNNYNNLDGDDQTTFTPSTARDNSFDLICTATYTVDGVPYSTVSDNDVAVSVIATSAQPATITEQPLSTSYLIGSKDIFTLSTNATSSDGGSLSFQWYTSSNNSSFTAVSGANNVAYIPPGRDKAGKVYYYCKITNSIDSSNGMTYTTTVKTNTATINFNTVANLGGTWSGDGTKASPYLIANQSDLVLLRDMVNKGITFGGCYFKITADITLPDNWVPIGAIMTGKLGSYTGKYMWPFGGILDGDNHTLTVPDGGLPLFGYVRNAVVENLNIYGTKIAGYGLVNNYEVDYGPTGSYGDFTKNGYQQTINIENVTLKSGSSTLKSGFIGGYASGANTVNFYDCTVESGVTIGYDKSQSDIGSFGGSFNGMMENCVSNATVYGVNNVGGLVGTKGQSMGYLNIMDSAFHGSVVATGTYVGGVMGSGYNVTSAPNSPCVTIQNCYVDGSLTGSDYIGGLFGGEPVVKQCWANGIGYIQNNCFTGMITATKSGAGYVGGVIGNMNSLDRYNVIANNYYLEGCGATKAIGAVASVDKTATTRYNRSDDPTGVDAGQLAKSATAAQMKDGTVVAALNAGLNSSGNWVQGTNDPVFGHNKGYLIYFTVTGYTSTIHGGDSFDQGALGITAAYSDGSTKTIAAKDVTFTGFNSDTKGYITVTAAYDNHFTMIEINVVDNADYSSDITAAKTAVSGGSYDFDMTAANSADDVKAALEKEIAKFDLKGVAAAVTMDSVTPAVAGTADHKTGSDGSFSATVSLAKGTGAAALSDTVTVTGMIKATAYSAEWQNLFKDVTKDDWFFDAVKYASEHQLFKGTSDTAFSPDLAMTRAMLVTVLYRLDGEPKVDTKNIFSDVKDGAWYSDTILWASENKIAAGYGDSLFGPDDNVTREQLAVILYNYAQYKDADVTAGGDLLAFGDASKVSSWAADAMKWAVGKGLISGITKTTLDPKGNATRSQVATILMRYTAE